jgi:4-hydroxyphenylpyruvate dioxygenase
MTSQPTVVPHAAGEDPMPLLGIDHVEVWCGNAAQAAYFYVHALGFTETAYAGLETGVRDRASHVLEQGDVRLVVTGALVPGHEIGEHHRRHGDGVRVIALAVPDAERAYEAALARGARGLRAPSEAADEHGAVRLATIATFGDTLHTFVERGAYGGPFLPGYVARDGATPGGGCGLAAIDHIVGNVELGEMQPWVRFYEDVFGMTELLRFSGEAISTEYSALMSKVVSSGDGRIKLPINEPAAGRRRSQIDEFLEFYSGPGAQHIAVTTHDIVATVEAMQRRGIAFLCTPDSYYDDVRERVGEIDEDVDDLRRLGILVDRDDEGYLLQVFTKPVGDRPTMFFEVIERHGARSFGEGNFRALFEAIEREQALRGNL